MAEKVNSLALFDFDGTISKKDSFLEFIKFTNGKIHFWIGVILLSPYIFLYKLSIISNNRLKEYFLTFFWRNESLEKLTNKGNVFSECFIPKIVKEEANKRIRWHLEQGHLVIVVTASSDIWLSKWCEINNLGLLSTKLEVNQNKITGKIEGLNCHGREKVRRVIEKFDMNSFENIYAYGDDQSDSHMLELANHKYMNLF